jgi:hypothetical protein
MLFRAADAVRDHFLNSARRRFNAIGFGSHSALDARHPHAGIFVKKLLPDGSQAQIGAALKAGVAVPRAGHMEFGLFGPDGNQDSIFGFLLHAASLSPQG